MTDCTDLVADSLKQTDLPATRLSLDEGDNDLPRFLAYLAAAFQQVNEEIEIGGLCATPSGHL